MIVVVSPYHLTTREAPALAALLLADAVVTLRPVPAGPADRAAFGSAMAGSPRYRALLERWKWTEPLWRAGVLAGQHDGEDPRDDARACRESMRLDPACEALRPLMCADLHDDGRALDAVAADLLKGGPDPGISLPVLAALDRFASRHGMAVARSEPASVAQRAEAALARAVLAVSVPALVQASGERLLHARGVLAAERGALARALQAAQDAPGPGSQAEAYRAAADFSRAFDERRGAIMDPAVDDDDVPRTIEGAIAIECVQLPGDAIVRSSLRALGVLDPRAQRAARTTRAPAPPAPHAGALLRPERHVVAWIVRRLGVARGGPGGRR